VRYQSTRGGVTGASFEEVLLAGLAADGGLFIPETWPQMTIAELDGVRSLSYPQLAAAVAGRFVGDAFSAEELDEAAAEAYRGFRHDEVAPLRQLDDDLYLLELFWGPTLSFKDYALQLLGVLFDRLLTRRGERLTIVGATSGDTGSAAIEALGGMPSVDVIILHPHGRVSEVQRRQMTTVHHDNIHNIAIEGTFDDCQDLVKAMFADAEFRDELRLSAVNSINFGRIMAQVTYYLWATLQLDATESGIGFSVPTGNFGNIYAGYVARSIGVPINWLVAGNNRNNGLNRFFRTGTLTIETVTPTITPAMDIQIPSNLERLLFELYDHDGDALASAMEAFRRNGTMSVPTARLSTAKSVFDSMWMSDEAVEGFIGQVAADHQITVDPHTAIGLAAAYMRPRQPGSPFVAIATAHPAKFPEAVERATGSRPVLPPELEDLYQRQERFDVLDNDLEAVKAAVRSSSRR